MDPDTLKKVNKGDYKMKTLNLLPSGRNGVIKSLKGGKGFLSRITSMGFTPSSKVTVIRNAEKGPLLVHLRDSFIALGRKEASRIEVTEVTE